MVSRDTTLVPPLRLCIGPARETGLSMVREGGTCHLVKKGKERNVEEYRDLEIKVMGHSPCEFMHDLYTAEIYMIA